MHVRACACKCRSSASANKCRYVYIYIIFLSTATPQASFESDGEVCIRTSTTQPRRQVRDLLSCFQKMRRGEKKDDDHEYDGDDGDADVDAGSCGFCACSCDRHPCSGKGHHNAL